MKRPISFLQFALLFLLLTLAGGMFTAIQAKPGTHDVHAEKSQIDLSIFKSKTYVVRKEDSQIEFSIMKWLVIKEEGKFKDFSGKISYEPERPALTTAEFTVQVASVDSRSAGRDEAIRSEGFLNAYKYPTITFKSVACEPAGEKLLNVTGDLTIRGVTRRLVIPVKVLGVNKVGGDVGELAGFESTFTINREEFGIAMGESVIGKEITLHLVLGAWLERGTAKK